MLEAVQPYEASGEQGGQLAGCTEGVGAGQGERTMVEGESRR